MKKDSSYHDFVVYDLFSRVREVSSRPMMSGWCLYSSGVPFAAIIGNQLYLKAKGEVAETLAKRGWQKFQYEKSGGKTVHMNYWRVPDELFDDQELLTETVREVL
ncbi:MAG: TfoX/Sxy family protein [Candidatus Paceibacterota bacterium]|jgi:DNA transformation protein